jgi:hypothetical protein
MATGTEPKLKAKKKRKYKPKPKTKKKCTMCKIMLPISEYYFCKNNGVSYAKSECKACGNARNKKIKQKKQKEKIKAAAPRTPEKIAYYKEYYAKNREKFREYNKTFRERHPTYNRDMSRRRRETLKKVKDALTEADA